MRTPLTPAASILLVLLAVLGVAAASPLSSLAPGSPSEPGSPFPSPLVSFPSFSSFSFSHHLASPTPSIAPLSFTPLPLADPPSLPSFAFLKGEEGIREGFSDLHSSRFAFSEAGEKLPLSISCRLLFAVLFLVALSRSSAPVKGGKSARRRNSIVLIDLPGTPFEDTHAVTLPKVKSGWRFACMLFVASLFLSGAAAWSGPNGTIPSSFSSASGSVSVVDALCETSYKLKERNEKNCERARRRNMKRRTVNEEDCGVVGLLAFLKAVVESRVVRFLRRVALSIAVGTVADALGVGKVVFFLQLAVQYMKSGKGRRGSQGMNWSQWVVIVVGLWMIFGMETSWAMDPLNPHSGAGQLSHNVLHLEGENEDDGSSSASLNPTSDFFPVFFMDELSTSFDVVPVDDIATEGDRMILKAIIPDNSMANGILSDSLTEEDNAYTQIDWLMGQFNQVMVGKKRSFVVVLSGHGLDPHDISVLRDDVRACPSRKTFASNSDWRNLYDGADDHIFAFFSLCHETLNFDPRGFVGGELDIHGRGYLGILALIALWSSSCKELEGKTLRVVADCCYSGCMVETLETFMCSQDDRLHGLQKTLRRNPMCINAACGPNQPALSGLFFPLWAAAYICKMSIRDLDGHDHQGITDQHASFYETGAVGGTFVSGNLESFRDDILNSNSDMTSCYRILMGNATEAITSAAAENIDTFTRQVNNMSRPDWPFKDSFEKANRNLNTSQEVYNRVSENGIGLYLRPTTLSDKKFDPKKLPSRGTEQKPPIPDGIMSFQAGDGDMTLIVANNQETVILIDGGREYSFIEAWKEVLRFVDRITHIIVTHHDEDHTSGVRLLLWCIEHAKDSHSDLYPDLTNCKIYMNTRESVMAHRGFTHEGHIKKLAADLGIKIEKSIADSLDSPIGIPTPKSCDLKCHILAPWHDLVNEAVDCYDVAKEKESTQGMTKYGNTTAANVLSIVVCAVWKEKYAFLFTGDAHLHSVSLAAEQFFTTHSGISRFTYVDIPHHGSHPSNFVDVPDKFQLWNQLPADKYVLSTCGNGDGPQTDDVHSLLKQAHAQGGKVLVLYGMRKSGIFCRCQEDPFNSSFEKQRRNEREEIAKLELEKREVEKRKVDNEKKRKNNRRRDAEINKDLEKKKEDLQVAKKKWRSYWREEKSKYSSNEWVCTKCINTDLEGTLVTSTTNYHLTEFPE